MLVVQVRLTVNLASPTIERVIGKMQAAHLDLISILQTKIAKESPDDLPRLLTLRKEAAAESPDFFNSAESFKERTNAALDIKGRIEFFALYKEEWPKKKYELAYGDLAAFNAGLTGILGVAETSSEKARLEAMRREHCDLGDACVAFDQFQPECGGTLRTTPTIEWFFVTEPTKERLASLRSLPALSVEATGITLEDWPVEGQLSEGGAGSKPRTARALSSFDAARQEVDGKLAALKLGPMTDAELIAIRLFTGTMGKARYNVALRFLSGQAPYLKARFHEEMAGNKYTTTMQTINDAIRRLGKIANATTVWRGMSGGLPPESFLNPGTCGIAGGVEFAPVGCAPDEAVSVKWATNDPAVPGLVFQFNQGIDRGANTGPFTDYPELSEVTLPPCTFFEVQGCRIKRSFTTASGYQHEGALLYVDLAPQLFSS